MPIKDKVAAWFIQHYVIPRSQVIDSPGFVIFKVSYKTDIYSRQVVMPESLFVSIEKQVIKKYGKRGEQVLYSTGKKFGYRFASVTHVVTIKDTDEKGFLSFVNILSKFVEGTYASSISNAVDMKQRTIRFNFDNFVICRKSGLGYLISAGGIGGIWSKMLSNPAVEAVQTKCQGRGDKECEVIAASEEVLKKKGFKVFGERNLNGLEQHLNYRTVNEIRPVQYAKNSLKEMIDTGFFEFHKGIVSYKSERYFIVEVSLTYLIEMEISKFRDGEKLLFDLSFEYGKTLAQKEKSQDPCKFITDFMSALGWGDVLASKKDGKYMIHAKYFPWTKWYKDIKYVIFRGMVSGIISGLTKKRIVLGKFKTSLISGYLSLNCEEG